MPRGNLPLMKLLSEETGGLEVVPLQFSERELKR